MKKRVIRLGKARKQLLLSLIVAVCIPGLGIAQQDTTGIGSLSGYFSSRNVLRFGDFLFDQGDYLRAASEYQRGLFLGVPDQQHRIFYQIGRCYYLASQPVQASLYFERAAHHPQSQAFQDSAFFAYTAALFFAGQYTEFTEAMHSFRSGVISPDFLTRLDILQAGYYMRERQWQKARLFLSESAQEHSGIGEEYPFSEMVRFADRGMNLSRKSPFLAGAMSAIIPGTGKMYAGRFGDGLFSMLLIGGTSWLAYEGFRDSGISSFRGWFFGGVAFFFHAGNVYGSVKAAQIMNRFHEEMLAHDVETHLSVTIRF
jgi:TM2 domain-containing membrane protein YozV